MAKATKATKETRIEAVRLLLLEGREPTRVVLDITKSFSIGERQAWNYISEAQEQIRSVGEVDRAYRLAEHIAVRRDIRQRAKKANDFRAELAAAQDEARLLALYPADKIEHGGFDGGAIPVAFIDYRQGLKQSDDSTDA